MQTISVQVVFKIQLRQRFDTKNWHEIKFDRFFRQFGDEKHFRLNTQQTKFTELVLSGHKSISLKENRRGVVLSQRGSQLNL